ncbi:major facilitator superfamily domain-containing protein [Armillaria luteobubalina]|uniref:Major facilitator superfamily domain-containing protein n=1 Tax=Armillaria luteobubalina TaxID=153913 RepID=A0AA39QGL8_9AGAR|nr:major facilitator superfamily domain-containing protein [Armillaria luteobubalina]
MTVTTIDEESPLLQPQHKPKRTPLPWFQFCIVLVLQLAEPLTSQVIFPFAPQLIRDIGITHGDETKVGYYVGVMQSLFFLTQSMTVLQWSRVSDRVGRKPVILTGLFGLCISMYCFGLSKTFWGLVLSRSLNGALNGNIGVIKSMMAEMTDATNISQAYAYLPISWCTGATLGPIIGGALARPAEQFPSLFGNSAFLKEYPYFLPCAVPACFSAVAWLVTYKYLKETVKHPQPVSSLFFKPSEDQDANKTTPELSDDEKPLPMRSLLIPRVLIAGANYACLSLVEIAFKAIQPVFLSMPLELGGLGLNPAFIGNILSVYGIFNGLFQIFFFARINDTLGSKTTFFIGMASSIPVFVSFPVISTLVKANGLCTLVWVVLAVQIVSSIAISLSYGAIFIYIAAASPNRASLGATNGLCQMAVSICRAIGPAGANSLFSLSLKQSFLGGYMVYYVLLATVCASLVVASFLPRRL